MLILQARRKDELTIKDGKEHAHMTKFNSPGSLAGYWENILALKLASEAGSKDSGAIGDIKFKTCNDVQKIRRGKNVMNYLNKIT